MCNRRPALSVAGMTNTAIEVHDLHKNYEHQPVLRGVSFAVGDGEIFGITGRNGAGKTTTVEILQGLRSRDSGQVEVLGFDPGRDRKRLRPLMGSQLQTSALPERLRVTEALRLFARLAGGRIDWRNLAETWGLEALMGKSFGSLSGGQRQRLFLALAMINQPRLVFLDELTQGLDPLARRETWRLIEQARDQGTTVMLVTHDMEEAERLCDRVAVLNDGELLTCGPPVQLATAMGTVRVRFSSPSAGGLQGLARLPGVAEVGYDGASADITVDPKSVVHLATELARRDLAPPDFTVIRPSLEDAVLSLLNGDHR
jgi:ABC-2 type transport system ATP-binding protein